MKQTMRYILVMSACVALGMMSSASSATELVWTPINPSFGGNTYNGSWLLSQANAQNKYSSRSSSSGRTLIDSFEERIYSQALYQLSTDLLEYAYGSDSTLLEGETEENVTIGDYQINILEQEGQNIKVTITDTSTGGKTIVNIPLTWY